MKPIAMVQLALLPFCVALVVIKDDSHCIYRELLLVVSLMSSCARAMPRALRVLCATFHCHNTRGNSVLILKSGIIISLFLRSQNTKIKRAFSGAAKYRGPHPYYHGCRLDDSLSFFNIILPNSIIL